jgi:exodeoxyribonuclease VII small subunit
MPKQQSPDLDAQRSTGNRTDPSGSARISDSDPANAVSDSSGSAPADAAVAASFEQALAELEAIVARMETGELSLEQSLSAYKRGAALLQYCQSALRDAQQQVKVLESGVLQEFRALDSDGE